MQRKESSERKCETAEWIREPFGISTLLGIPFHRVTMEETVRRCEELLEDRSEPSYIVTANVDFTYLASKNPALREFIFHSDLVICDGLPLVKLSKLCGGGELPERVAGSDLGMPLLELCARRGFSVYFLGSDDKTLNQLKSVLAEKLPDLEVAGHCSPPIGPVESWDDAALSVEIEKASPQLLLVALGCPKQEQWIARNYRSLGVPLSIGVGATLDFIVGKQHRAPKFAQKLCLEWFWRMCTNPKRFVKRYAKDLGFLASAAWRQILDARAIENSVQAADLSAAEHHGFEVRSGSWQTGGLSSCRELSSAGSLLIDCSLVQQIGASELGQLCEVARQVHRAGRFFGIVEPTRVVRQIIEHQKLEAQLPIVADFKALETDGATSQTSRISEFEGWSKSSPTGSKVEA